MPPDRGWQGLPPVECDGQAWPLPFAAQVLGIDERDLRDMVRLVGLQPVGTIKVAGFARSGRHPRAYSAPALVALHEGIRRLAQQL